MFTQMRALAAHIYRKFRFDDSQFLNADAATLGAVMARQKMKLGWQGIQCLPQKSGCEKKEAYDLNDPNKAAEAQTLDHYMNDFNSVVSQMPLDQCIELTKKHRFNSIKDIGC